ncbi:MAG: hypothetical protein EPN72_14165 [Nevskiaceae bacterium]|nr:MAG: hypothetical protein EPN63_02030 [Nevskiaceae bacterium]TBR71342.1 MAG: hypothetical protein EPN72_14165 [Nevskiaceae bacterium]
MTEESSDPRPSREMTAAPRRGTWLAAIAVLVVLALLAVIGVGGWYGWQWYQAQEQARGAQQQALAATRTAVAELDRRLAQADGKEQSTQDGVKALQAQVDVLQQKLDTVGQALDGGRRGVQVALVEQLLMTANEAVQVGRAPQAAQRALAAADARLAALHDPRFFAVRQAIADEREALSAVAQPDVAGTAIAIGRLLDTVAELPLRGTPEALPAPQTVVTDDVGQSAWARGWSRLVAGLGALLRVQHHDHGVEPLLSPAEHAVVGAVLALRLDTARAALVQGDAAVYRSTLKAAGDWLARYYRPQDPAVSTMAQQLRELAGVDVAPVLPDISASLVLLRKQQAVE